MADRDNYRGKGKLKCKMPDCPIGPQADHALGYPEHTAEASQVRGPKRVQGWTRQEREMNK